MSKLIVGCGSIAILIVASYFVLNDGDTNRNESATKSEKEIVAYSAINDKQSILNQNVSFEPELTVKSVTPHEPQPSNTMDVQSITDSINTAYKAYLGESRSTEHEIIAFYTDERFRAAYSEYGLSQSQIDTLISIRDSFLSDISQSGKEYYYLRWMNAPHQILMDELAYRLQSLFLDNEINDYGISSIELYQRAKEPLVVIYGNNTNLLIDKFAPYLLLQILSSQELAYTLPANDSHIDPNQVSAYKVLKAFLLNELSYTKQQPESDLDIPQFKTYQIN